MTTPKKIASNAKNALKSTGPRTPEGKVRIPMMVMGDSDRIVMGVSDA